MSGEFDVNHVDTSEQMMGANAGTSLFYLDSSDNEGEIG